MSIPVIDGFKLIQIDNCQSHMGVLCGQARPVRSEVSIELAAVGEPSQGVAMSQALVANFSEFPLGDVLVADHHKNTLAKLELRHLHRIPAQFPRAVTGVLVVDFFVC